MKFDIIISDDNQYAHLRIREVVVQSVAISLVAAMSDLHKQKNIRRFLLDTRGMPSRTSPFDDYQMANREVASAGFPPRTRVVVLKSPGDSSHDFIETVGQNAGQNIRLFEDMSTAVAWLRE